ncbi:MAG: hypothetical protein K1X75_04960 [Leptospirales bacterium]|nr:hypothetical protein [Leptospirales bacterium]
MRVRPWPLAAALALVLFLRAPLYGEDSSRPPEGQPVSGVASSALRELRIVQKLPRVDAPWLASRLQERRAVALELGDYLLTDLDAVRYAQVIEVYDQSQWRTLRLKHAATDCALALLQRTDGTTTPRRMVSAPPGAGAGLTVVGFPRSGEDESALPAVFRGLSREGVSGSDIDFALQGKVAMVGELPDGEQIYASAVAMSEGRALGVIHWDDRQSGRFMPASVIQRVLDDVADGAYDGLRRTGIDLLPARHSALRRWLGIEGKPGGALAARIEFGSPAYRLLQAGDVLVEAGGDMIAPDGQVMTAAGAIPLDLRYSLAPQGLRIRLLRNGVEQSVELPKSSYSGPPQLRRSMESVRSYFLAAGLVFQELDYDLIRQMQGSSALAEYRYRYFAADQLNEEADRDVLLTNRLEDRANAGAASFVGGVVQSINGRRVRSLRDLAREWRELRATRVVLQFLNRSDALILGIEEAGAIERRIEARYQPQEAGRVH